MKKKWWGTATGAALITVLLSVVPGTSAQAYSPTPDAIYQLGADEACLKGRSNCAIYPKSAELPSGRIVASFEKATVGPTGTAVGETLPIYTSDDYGDSWQHIAELEAPAYLSDDPEVAKYTSNWTNPFLYVLPQDVGGLKKDTLLLASVVTGEDVYYKEQKEADPSWLPTRDGDRKDMAIALYSSTDEGVNWKFENIIATGGWEGSYGVLHSTENVYAQNDPLWEPYLMVYDNQLVAYYSDENEYSSYDPNTGLLTPDPTNDTARDPVTQILVHKTWDGSGPWSEPVVDVAGTVAGANSKGRPGMTTVVPTTDGKWLLTYEQGGARISDDPLRFWDKPRINLLTAAGASIHSAGSPVLITMPKPDGSWRILFNNDQGSNGGDLYINESGSSTGPWTRYQTSVNQAYSRNLQYVTETGQILIIANKGISNIVRAHVDLGNSAGAYYQVKNRKTGQVLGTSNHTNDANRGNGNVPDVRLETAGSVANTDTQYWHLVTKPDGKKTLLNKSGGREAAIWSGSAIAGQRIGQWVDNTNAGLWTVADTGDGFVQFQSAKNPNLYLSGTAADAPVTLQNATSDGSQDWQLVRLAPTASSLTDGSRSPALLDSDLVSPGATVTLDASAFTPSGAARNADSTGAVYLLSGGAVQALGDVAFGADQRGQVTLPDSVASGGSLSLAVVFDQTPLLWDSATVAAPAPDTTRPTSTLVSPTTAGPFSSIALHVDATDDRGLKRVTANIYRDGALVKSTQTAANGATSATHTATVSLPTGDYTIKYNSEDLAGNISTTRTFAVTIDNTPPTVTVKDGVSFTVGRDGGYDLVSFKLHDVGKVDKVTINGSVKNLTDNAWSDVNYVKPGVFGAVRGENTMVVYDIAGNTTTVTFTLN